MSPRKITVTKIDSRYPQSETIYEVILTYLTAVCDIVDCNGNSCTFIESEYVPLEKMFEMLQWDIPYVTVVKRGVGKYHVCLALYKMDGETFLYPVVTIRVTQA